MPLQILIKIISRQKSSQEFWEGKLLRLKKYDMPAIMMTSIIATREEVEEQIDTAVELVEKIEEYVLKEMG